MALVRRQVQDFGGSPHCSLIGGGRSAPDRAAPLNGALVRYLDFNDAQLARGESCHPSDTASPASQTRILLAKADLTIGEPCSACRALPRISAAS